MKTVCPVAFLLAFAACSAAPMTKASAPVPLTVAEDANPDVIWVVREVEIENRLDGSENEILTKYGLFACYRRPPANPGPPECFLAKTISSLDDLMWPGAVYLKEGKPVQVPGR